MIVSAPTSLRGRLSAVVANSMRLAAWVENPSRFAAAIPAGKMRLRVDASCRIATGLASGAKCPGQARRVGPALRVPEPVEYCAWHYRHRRCLYRKAFRRPEDAVLPAEAPLAPPISQPVPAAPGSYALRLHPLPADSAYPRIRPARMMLLFPEPFGPAKTVRTGNDQSVIRSSIRTMS